jgi:anti-sigma B factor antagonist
VKIKQKALESVMVLELSGHIMGGPDYDRFHSEIKELVKQGRVDILLDFSKVTWINSTGLGLLISAHHTLCREGGRLKICGVSSRVRGIMTVSQLTRVFETHDSCQDALAAFARTQA